MGLGDEQCDREVGDECLVHWRGLRDRAEESGGVAEKVGWESYAMGSSRLLRKKRQNSVSDGRT